MLEQANDTGAAPPPFVPPPTVPAPAHVDGPHAVELEAPPRIPSVPGERVPAPITDAPADIDAGSGDTGQGPPNGGLLDILEGLPLDGPIPCVDTDTIFRPGLGTLDCATGALLEVAEGVDPCTIELPLPVGVECPAVLPE
jgi:hypothetical protein